MPLTPPPRLPPHLPHLPHLPPPPPTPPPHRPSDAIDYFVKSQKAFAFGLDPDADKAVKAAFTPDDDAPTVPRANKEAQPAIELNNIALGAMGSRVLSTALLGVGPGLTGGAPPGGGIADGIDPPIPSCPYQCLQALSLESCRVGDGGAIALGKLLTHDATTRGLSLLRLDITVNTGPSALLPRTRAPRANATPYL